MVASGRSCQVAAFVLSLSLVAASAPGQAPGPAVGGPHGSRDLWAGDFDPISGGGPLYGEVLVSSSADGVVALALDQLDATGPSDGIVEYLAIFNAQGPLEDALYFRGPARVELRQESLRLVALDGATAMVLSMGTADEPVDGVVPGAVVYRLGGGGSLIYQAHELELSLEEMVAVALVVEPRDVRRFTPVPDAWFTQNPAPPDDDSGGGGCAASCNKKCRDGGTCSVTCPLGQCAECKCDTGARCYCRNA